MEKLARAAVLFLFVLALVCPAFAEDEVDIMSADDDIMGMAEASGEGVITGTALSVDIAASTITVKQDDGAQNVFNVIVDETILWRGIEDIELGSIADGEAVEVGYYTDDTGKLIASWVDVFVEEENSSMMEEEAVETPGAEPENE